MADQSEDVCCVCGRSEDHSLNERGKFKVELRPYGPGGNPICFECATSTPEQLEQTKRAFGAILEGAQAMGGGVATITDHGVEPGIPLGVHNAQADPASDRGDTGSCDGGGR